MKRLLLPLLAALALPTAVNAFPWGNDIVVKTDLGTKILVKESVVNVSTYLWDEWVNLFERIVKDNQNEYDQCRLDNISASDCSFLLADKEENEAILEISKAWRDKPKSFIKIVFRPIFIDLNNKKIAGDYETIFCINPKLSTNDQEEILFASSIKSSSLPNRQSTLAFESTKSKVCDKYAKF